MKHVAQIQQNTLTGASEAACSHSELFVDEKLQQLHIVNDYLIWHQFVSECMCVITNVLQKRQNKHTADKLARDSAWVFICQ